MSADRWFDAGRGMAAVERPGPGGPVLWLHGYTLDSRIWFDLWDRLPGWRHLALDLPGHGRSGPLVAGTDLVGLARGIGEIAIRHGVRHLVGLSFGGMVALQVAIEFPTTFATLALGAPALAGGPQDRHAQARNIELGRLYQARGRGPWIGDLWMTSPPNIFTGAASDPALYARLSAIVSDHHWEELSDTRMQALTAVAQSSQDLNRIAADTTVFIGDGDDDAFKRCAELIRRGIPGCRRIYLEDTGHLTLLERAGTIHTVLDAHFRTAEQHGRIPDQAYLRGGSYGRHA